jgi:hypothetical protein
MRKLMISTGMLVRPGARSSFFFQKRIDAALLGLLAKWPFLREVLACSNQFAFDKPACFIWAQTVGGWFWAWILPNRWLLGRELPYRIEEPRGN